MKKILTALLFIALTATVSGAAKLPVQTSYGESALLPALENFICTPARTTMLTAVSGEKGYWAERSYTAQNGKKFHAVIINGAAPTGWQAKKIPETQTDGVWGEGAAFRSLKIANFDANLEQHPYLGLSLAIRLPDAVLTIESERATQEELINFSEMLLKQHPAR